MRREEEAQATSIVALGVRHKVPIWLEGFLDFLAFASFFPACVGVVITFASGASLGAALLFLPLVAALFLRAWLLRPPRRAPGTISVEPDRMLVVWGTKRRHIQRGKLAGAGVDVGARSVVLDLTLGAQLELELARQADVRTLERWAGARVSDRTLRLPLEPPVGSFGGGALGVFAAFVAFALVRATMGSDSSIPPLVLGASLLLAIGSTLRMARSHVEVGVDGANVRLGLGRRFLPAANIASAVQIENEAEGSRRSRIVLRDGGVIDLLLGNAEHARRLVARIQEIVARVDRPGGDPARFRRQGRSLVAWKRHLSDVVHPEGSFRDNPVTIEAASRVLGSAQASPEARIGAALALRATGVRVAFDDDGTIEPGAGDAAAVTADPEMRRLFELAAEEEVDEEELFTRIAALEKRRR